jgi:cytochrome c5
MFQRPRADRFPATLAVLALAAAAGCAAGDDASTDAGSDAVAPITGLSTGSSCPDGSTLSYASFGQTFFETYCLRCHSAAVSGAERSAPVGRNFDDLPMIRSLAHMIDQFAAAGPRGEHRAMPPGDQQPTLAERTHLGEWLACGAPP